MRILDTTDEEILQAKTWLDHIVSLDLSPEFTTIKIDDLIRIVAWYGAVRQAVPMSPNGDFVFLKRTPEAEH